MSTDVTSSIEITVDNTEVTNDVATDLVASNLHCITPEEQESIVNGYKNEYSIVGDALYASINAEETPQWLATLLDNAVSNAVANGMTNYGLLVQDVRNAIDAIDVAKNTYVEQINFTADVNGIIGTHLETLNATLGNTYATKIELDIVEANANYALTMAITDLTAAYSNEINSRITTIQNAYSAADRALADDITALTVVFTDQESTLSGIAEAVSGLQTYVGLDDNGDPDGTGLLNGITSLSKFFVDLENEVTGETGHVATSLAELQITSKAYADDIGAAVENKFAYNSIINLDGIYYLSGFGLTTTGTSGMGTETNPIIDSEFWINAQRLKLTNSNGGTVTPFTIDISPTNPQLTFNGAVSFNKVTGVPDYALNTDAQNYANTAESNAKAYTNTAISNLSFDSPEVVTFTYAPTTQYYTEGSIWRHQKTVSVGGSSSTQYDHYISLGNGSWRYIGGTYIDGSQIVTGSIDTASLGVGLKLSSSDNLFYINMLTKELKATSSNGDYVKITPGTMQFVDVSTPANNLTWQNGTLTLPHASVDTLQIAGNAVTVPASAQGIYSAQVTITIPQDCYVLGIATFTQGDGKAGHWWYLYFNDSPAYGVKPINGTTGAMSKSVWCTAGNVTVKVACAISSGDAECTITALAAMR